MKKEDLAIYKYKDTIIEMIQNNPVVVIEAPTGSGKTTQIPQIIFASGINQWGMIGVTQPRRIAAYSVSSRIAFEMGVELGKLVGYKIRFDDYTSSDTQIKIMTDGILLEELRSDPSLLKYSIIMVDEAHERSLNIDFILGLLKNILRKRNDLKVVVSSATINAKLFSEFFDNAPVLSINARQFPVDIKYLPVGNSNDSDMIQSKIMDIVKNIEIKKPHVSKRQRGYDEKKAKLAVKARQTKWAPVWIVIKKYGKGKRVHPSATTRIKRNWRRTKLHIKPRKNKKWHLG